MRGENWLRSAMTIGGGTFGVQQGKGAQPQCFTSGMLHPTRAMANYIHTHSWLWLVALSSSYL